MSEKLEQEASKKVKKCNMYTINHVRLCDIFKPKGAILVQFSEISNTIGPKWKKRPLEQTPKRKAEYEWAGSSSINQFDYDCYALPRYGSISIPALWLHFSENCCAQALNPGFHYAQSRVAFLAL